MLAASVRPGARGAAAAAIAVLVVSLLLRVALLAVAAAHVRVVEELLEHLDDARLDLVTLAHL